MSSSSSSSSSPQQTKSVLEHGIQPGKTRIGWVGTGVMGISMAGHVLRACQLGFPVTLYNRTPERARPLIESSGGKAKLASTVQELAEQSDIVFTIVGYPKDVRDIYLGTKDSKGILDSLPSGGIAVDMTTSEPSLAKELYEYGKSKNISVLDAPVSGGDIGAREARLSIMVGGDQPVMYAILPILQSMGKNITYLGPAGSGQYTKGVNQILIANNMVGVCEGLLYGYRAGLDLTTVIQAVGAGAASSWSINNLGARIVQRNFAPGFLVEHFIKDMSIVLGEARSLKISLPGLALAQQLYTALVAQGGDKLGTQALMLALEHINNIQVPNDKPMVACVLPNVPRATEAVTQVAQIQQTAQAAAAQVAQALQQQQQQTNSASATASSSSSSTASTETK